MTPVETVLNRHGTAAPTLAEEIVRLQAQVDSLTHDLQTERNSYSRHTLNEDVFLPRPGQPLILFETADGLRQIRNQDTFVWWDGRLKDQIARPLMRPITAAIQDAHLALPCRTYRLKTRRPYPALYDGCPVEVVHYKEDVSI